MRDPAVAECAPGKHERSAGPHLRPDRGERSSRSACCSGGASDRGGIGSSTLLRRRRGVARHGRRRRVLAADHRGFLHAGFFHLLFNMLSLYILGGLLEPAVGRLRFGSSTSCRSSPARSACWSQPTAHRRRLRRNLRADGRDGVMMRNRGFNVMESGLPIWLGLNLVITFSVTGSRRRSHRRLHRRRRRCRGHLRARGPGAGAGGRARGRMRGPCCRGRGRRDRGLGSA